MARRDVVEITCDRCNRVETQLTGEVARRDDMKYELTASYHGETIQFEDLCHRCREAVKGYYNRIAKKADDQLPTPKESSDSPAPVPAPVELEEVQKKRSFLGGK